MVSILVFGSLETTVLPIYMRCRCWEHLLRDSWKLCLWFALIQYFKIRLRRTSSSGMVWILFFGDFRTVSFNEVPFLKSIFLEIVWNFCLWFPLTHCFKICLWRASSSGMIRILFFGPLETPMLSYSTYKVVMFLKSILSSGIAWISIFDSHWPIFPNLFVKSTGTYFVIWACFLSHYCWDLSNGFSWQVIPSQNSSRFKYKIFFCYNASTIPPSKMHINFGDKESELFLMRVYRSYFWGRISEC